MRGFKKRNIGLVACRNPNGYNIFISILPNERLRGASRESYAERVFRFIAKL